MPLQSRSIVTAKILNLKFPNFFLDHIDFFYKTDYLSWTFLYMWVKYELIQMSFSAQNEIFRFSEICSIVIPIVIQKRGATPQNSSYKLFFLDSGPYDSHTSLCQRAACMVGCCANQGTLVTRALPEWKTPGGNSRSQGSRGWCSWK